MSVRQEQQPKRTELRGEEDRQKETAECLVGGDHEKLLFPQHRGLVRQHLAAASK